MASSVPLVPSVATVGPTQPPRRDFVGPAATSSVLVVGGEQVVVLGEIVVGLLTLHLVDE